MRARRTLAVALKGAIRRWRFHRYALYRSAPIYATCVYLLCLLVRLVGAVPFGRSVKNPLSLSGIVPAFRSLSAILKHVQESAGGFIVPLPIRQTYALSVRFTLYRSAPLLSAERDFTSPRPSLQRGARAPVSETSCFIIEALVQNLSKTKSTLLS